MSSLTGITKETSKGSGGVYEVWIGFLEGITGTTVSDGIVDFYAPAGHFKRYVVAKQAGSVFNYTETSDIATGSVLYDSTMTMIFRKNQVSKRNELKVMAKNELVVIVVDNNAPQSLTGSCTVGDIYCQGFAYCTNLGGAEVTSAEGTTGAQLGEGNTLTISTTVQETNPPLAITEENLLKIRNGQEVTTTV